MVMAPSFRSLLAFALAAATLAGAALGAALPQLGEGGLAVADRFAQVAALLLVERFGLLDERLEAAGVAALDGVVDRGAVGSHVGHISFSFRLPFQRWWKTFARTCARCSARRAQSMTVSWTRSSASPSGRSGWTAWSSSSSMGTN